MSGRPARGRFGAVAKAKAASPARTPSTGGGGGARPPGGDTGGGVGGEIGETGVGGGDPGGAGGGVGEPGGGTAPVPGNSSIRSQLAGNGGAGPAEVAITPTAITDESRAEGTGWADNQTRGCFPPPLVTS